VDQTVKKILDVRDGVVKTAYDDGEGGLIIHSEQDLTEFAEYTKEAYNNNPTGKGWGDNPIDRKNHIATLPTEIINHLNQVGIMRGYTILDQKAMKKWLNDPDNRVFRTRGGVV
jgi:hypothetical protein